MRLQHDRFVEMFADPENLRKLVESFERQLEPLKKALSQITVEQWLNLADNLERIDNFRLGANFDNSFRIENCVDEPAYNAKPILGFYGGVTRG